MKAHDWFLLVMAIIMGLGMAIILILGFLNYDKITLGRLW